MGDGVPLTEAALRRRRRQRRATAVFEFAEACKGGTFAEADLPGAHVPGKSFRCSSLGVQSSLTGTYVPGEFGMSGGCCEGDGFQDERQHVVMALRCLAGDLEIQGYDWGLFANQQYWTEDTTRAGQVRPRHVAGLLAHADLAAGPFCATQCDEVVAYSV